MKLYSENKDYKLYQGNMLDMSKVIEPNTIDSIVTDPPYGLTSITKRFGKEGSAPATTKNNDGSFARLSRGFMGKEWDGSGIEYNIDTWKNCYEVLKPGGYLLAFGGSRTFHRIACAIEDAGFEIRDTIMWLYGSGFPKSMNIGLAIDKKNGVESIKIGENRTSIFKANKNGKSQDFENKLEVGVVNLYKATNEWNGWGTALKPSFEPIIVARKPFKGSLVDNVIEYGVGGINIDECRVGNEKIEYYPTNLTEAHGNKFGNGAYMPKDTTKEPISHVGRFPANTILTYDETNFDEVCGGFPNTKGEIGRAGRKNGGNYNASSYKVGVVTDYGLKDSGSASRYFYCAKASKKDRDEGLDTFEIKGAKELLNREENSDGASWNGKYSSGNAFAGCGAPKKNTHPTVKPTELMQYLVRLVTPNGGTVLDPFNGSGSTGKAVMYENKERNKNYKYIGIELTEEYLPIAQARIEYVCNLKEKEQPQTTIFDYIGDSNE